MARSRKTRGSGILNVIAVSDTHTGCRLGLMHPDGAEIDDGGSVMPSKIQLKVWSWWEELWGEWVPKNTKGEPFAVVFNGDAVDGTHHNSTTQWSHNLEDQCEHFLKIMRPVVDLCEGRFYFIRGTEAHVGKSAKEEERLAKALNAVKNSEKQSSRWDLWLRMGGSNGPLCHFLHHIGTTSSAAHEASAVNAELTSIYGECARWRQEAPQIVCRSHRHRNCEVRLPLDGGGYATVFVTPAWQLKTPFAWKIAGARNTTPQIGASLIRLGDELHTRHFVHNIGRSEEVVL